MTNIVVLISGNGSNLQAIIDACIKGDIDGQVSAVISNRADAFGLQRAQQANIPTHVKSHTDFSDRESFDQAVMSIIDDYQPDIIVLAGYMRILTDGFVNHYLGKMVNIHPSLLPKYPGLHTHQRAIEAGDSEHGSSVHFVTPELDSGPIIEQSKVSIDAHDCPQSLLAKVQKAEHTLYPKVIQDIIAGRVVWQAE
ncbi:phosphoribosylglycinamide formyltransferase [Vibrio ezurae]|uniref:Phosphoribosylglycinamide formyltransferase n=1 Tax=Vibrio ezurae NBRC 102218 TaxID=1219080 RepID=U3AEI1_9VIBR|nr:phosphoribosylglycinamide formyltransferase [Vibrio ezurae]GAD78311.1 phosphoribosylglycinamide formyltransferase [Vibrio ezurae NBRC 102218]